MIESKFVEVTDRNVKDLGVNWSSLANYAVGVSGDGRGSPVQSAFSRTRDQTGSSGLDANRATTLGNQNDANTNTTNSSVSTTNPTTTNTVTSTNGTVTNTSSTGNTTSLNNTANTTSTAITGATNLVNDTLTALQSIANTDGTSRALAAVFSASQFQLVLNALQSQNDVKIVSNPTIVTLNNSQAKIEVGEDRPIPRYQYNQQTGSFEVSGFEYKPIGVNLNVTPQVNARGFIKLKVEPEVSQTSGTTSFGAAQIPIVSKRKAITEVSLKDGYTMGIGGLLSTQSTKGVTRVPLLGSIPGLGRLFRSDSSNASTTNLIIFITAKTISAEGAPVEQVFDSSRVRHLDLKREDLPGYRDGSDPFTPSTPPGDTPAAKKTGSRSNPGK